MPQNIMKRCTWDEKGYASSCLKLELAQVHVPGEAGGICQQQVLMGAYRVGCA
jgi:hypothetical protein